MKALKAIVIIMGVLIVAGVAVIVAELVKRVGGSAPGARSGGPPVETALPLPPGAAVADMTSTADRVILRVTAPQRPDALYILDPQSGAVRAVVTLGSPRPETTP